MNRSYAFVLVILAGLSLITVFSPALASVQNVATSAYISVKTVTPQVNQPIEVKIEVFPPPTVLGEVFHNLTVTLAGPAANITNLGPFATDSSGSKTFSCTITSIGTWQLYLSFPGELLTNGFFINGTESTIYYQPSNGTTTVNISPPIPPSDVGSWASKAPMHVARGSLGVAAVNGKIYAIGGSTQNLANNAVGGIRMTGDAVGTNEEYDPATDTWTFKSPMPTPRAAFGIAVYQNKIYCIGGGNSTRGTSVNEVYNPASDTWETKAPMPVAGSVQACVANGKIYLLSGNPTGGQLSYWVHDPITDSWTTKTPIPNFTFRWTSATLDDKIYILGGLNLYASGTTPNVYDAKTDTWSAIGFQLPIFGGAAAATTGVLAPKRIYLMGLGFSDKSPFDYAASDPTTQGWIPIASMPTGRSDFGIAVVDDVLYAIGGYAYLTPTAVNEQYTPIGFGSISPPTPSPTSTPTSPTPTPTPTPISTPSPSATQQPSPSTSGSPAGDNSGVQVYVYWIGAGAVAAAALVAAAVLLRKRH